MIDKLISIDWMAQSDKIIEYHIGKKLQINSDRIEFKREKISEGIF